MKFSIQHWSFLPIVIFISAICAPGLFQIAGLPSPISNAENRVGGIVLFIVTVWGIAFPLGIALSFILQKSFPKRFARG